MTRMLARLIPALRPLIAGLLALCLLATAGATASARGTMRDATGQMVLCTGTGPMRVMIDAQGQPIGPAHYCPDCAHTALAAIAPATPMVRRAGDITRAQFTRRAAPRALVLAGLRACARGPPML